VKKYDNSDADNGLFDLVEDMMTGFLDPHEPRLKKEHHAMMMAHAIRIVTSNILKRAEKTTETVRSLKEENLKLRALTTAKEVNKKKETKRIQTDTIKEVNKKRIEKGVQVTLEIPEERGEGQIVKKLDEILKRVRILEEKDRTGKEKNIDAEDTTTWNKVVGRKKKSNINLQEDLSADAPTRRNEIKKSRRRPSKSPKRIKDKGTCVTVEAKGDRPDKYEKILRKCK